MITLYTELGLEESSTTEEIKKAYYKLAHKYHPDKGGDKRIFDKITQMKDILLDKNNRFKYDLTLRSQREKNIRQVIKNKKRYYLCITNPEITGNMDKDNPLIDGTYTEEFFDVWYIIKPK